MNKNINIKQVVGAMICPQCLVDRKQSDFFGKERCYKCIYKEKTEGIPKKVKPKPVCKICGGNIPDHRRKFCSPECLDKQMHCHNHSYWVRNINFTKVEWN